MRVPEECLAAQGSNQLLRQPGAFKGNHGLILLYLKMDILSKYR